MKRLLLSCLVLLLAGPAFAQSPGTLDLLGPSTTPGAPPISTVAQMNAAINAMMVAKADAVNGVLTNPTIVGGSSSGAVPVLMPLTLVGFAVTCSGHPTGTVAMIATVITICP